MGVYNPHIPQILGEEWVPIRNENTQFSAAGNFVEYGHSFTLKTAKSVAEARLYMNDWRDGYGYAPVMFGIYPKGLEDKTGPIQRLVVPVSAGGITGNAMSLSGTMANAAWRPDGQVVSVAWNSTSGAQLQAAEFFFAANQYPILQGKRIVGLNLLYQGRAYNNLTLTPIVDPDPSTALTNVYIKDTAGTDPQIWYGSLSDLNVTLGTSPIARLSFGDSNFGWTASPNSDVMPWRYRDLQRFEATHASRIRVYMIFQPPSDGDNVSIDYVALEVLYCDETRVAYGGKYTLQNLGVCPITLRTVESFGAVTLPAGDYTVTLAQCDVGARDDGSIRTMPTSTLNALRELYEMPAHPGIEVKTTLTVGDTYTSKLTHVLPQLTLHDASNVLPEVHAYGRQGAAPVWGSLTPRQTIDDDVVSFAPYPQARYYARRFGNTTVPLTLSGASVAGLAVLGVPGSNASTPDNAALDIVGDIDLRIDATIDWSPSPNPMTLISKWNTSNFSYLFYIDITGFLVLTWSANGIATNTASSTVIVPPSTGRLAVRVTLDVDNGAAGRTLTFYTAPTMTGTFVQLGAPVIQAGVTSIFSGTAAVEVGTHTGGTSAPLLGVVHSVEIRNLIGGTAAANPIFSAQPAGTTNFTDAAGRAWTTGGVLNPYFETNVLNWTALGNATIARSTALAHQGVASMLITPDGVTTSPGAASDNFAVIAGQSYTLNGWMAQPNAGSITRQLNVIWKNAALGVISTDTISASFGGPNVWLNYGPNVFVAPALAAFASVTAAANFVTATPWYLDEVTLSSTTAATIIAGNTTSSVSITPTDFDALPEIVDGWKAVTQRFPIVPSMGGVTGITPAWSWSAPGELAGNRWEILAANALAISGVPGNMLVPAAQQLSAATYNAPNAGSAAFLNWLNPPVSGTADDPGTDAVLMFALDPPTVTGVTVTLQSQALTGFADCGRTPCCVPTALSYNQVTWPYRPTNVLNDLFDRNVASSAWGTASSGQIWATGGGGFSVTGGVGKVTPPANAYVISEVGVSLMDVTGSYRVQSSVAATGSDHWPSVTLRGNTSSNQVYIRTGFETNGTVTLFLTSVVAGAHTTLATMTWLTSYTPGTWINVRFSLIGNRFQGKAWLDGTVEPDNWMLTAQVTNAANQIAGSVGTRSIVGVGGAVPTFSFDNLVVTDLTMGYMELQRFDPVDVTWQTIMKAYNPALTTFNDYEARVGVASSYRMRQVNVLGFEGLWSVTGTSTVTEPGVTLPSCGTNMRGILIFTTNEDQDGSSNLAYAMTWEDTISENFSFPESSSMELSQQFDRDFQVAFHGTERGGEVFQRQLLLSNAAVALPRLANMTSIRDLAWADLPYVCVRDGIGDRWMSAIIINDGKVRRNRRLYNASLTVIEVTDTPSPVNP